MNENDTHTLIEIERDLNRIRNLDRRCLVFGSHTHQYDSYPVSNTELENLEGELSVRLPIEFRNFLLEFGYGAGPYYGLFSPEKILSEWRDFGQLYVGLPRRFPDPSKPFPFNQGQAEECYRTMEESRPASLLADWPANGCIPICFEGCTFYTFIVTAGELTGSLWSTNLDLDDNDQEVWNLAPKPPGILGLHPYKGEPRWEKALSPLPTFLEWYTAWLGQCLSDLEELKEKEKNQDWKFWQYYR